MATESRFILTVVLAITVVSGLVVAMEDDSFRFDLNEEDKFPSTNFVPAKLKISDSTYDHLLTHLDDQLTAENVVVPLNDYFPKDIESDERDDLDFVHEYDLNEDADEDDMNEVVRNFPNDALVSTGFGKRELTFAKVLSISKNGTKTFTKVRQSAKIGGNATTRATGSFNTSLDVSTSAAGNFDVNITSFSKGQHKKVVASGAVISSTTSKANIEKRRLWQHASGDSTIHVRTPITVDVKTSVRSGTETLKLPFRSFLTLFKAETNTTLNAFRTRSIIGGEVISRVAFANKTVSLTKSCTKIYVKSKSEDSTDVDDSRSEVQENSDGDVESLKVFQISMIRAKTHTWTRVVSQSKTQVVVDVITCAKSRAYGKSIEKGVAATFTGSGQVSWQKSRITIDSKHLQNLSPREYGVHFIKKQLESSSHIQFLGSPLKMTM